ncbi:CIC11C00000004871 [Sungouiella intermedia]|uniref:CIC11C00000004871 n=1 Tax=Sungouiella intermedia TaxID=45354 RepID=A0A1L0B731_9ASCO|nr:CIC11C00000004871 [[Candida] intermedia]
MKNKKNELWKLDLLEVKFKKASPRFPNTKKLLNAKNNSQLLKKLPRSHDEASKQILALKSDLFEKKFHGSYKKLLREVQRRFKQDQRSWTDAQKSLGEFFNNEKKVELLLQSRLIKLVTLAILTTKELKISPPDYFPDHLKTLITDKKNPANPSHFFITYCQNDKALNGYISKLWNAKEIKTLLGEIDWSFRKIRGDLSEAEKDARAKATGTKVKSVMNEDNDEEESEDSDDESGSEEEGHEAMDAEEAFDKFAGFDSMVGDSDEEQEFVADPNVNYNEITDEEASDSEQSESESEDDFFEGVEKESKTTKVTYKLPELATGYFSGGSDDEEDVDNDKVVKAATTTRKNRRGQRARQKIWEQKYGSGANHVKKERDRVASEREQRQQEYEERQRKRELKAAQGSGANGVPLGTGKSLSAPATAAVHPSWEAKKRAEEKLKNVKFEGKKITFD